MPERQIREQQDLQQALRSTRVLSMPLGNLFLLHLRWRLRSRVIGGPRPDLQLPFFAHF